MGGNAAKVPVALRSGELGSKFSFFSMNSDESQELTMLLTPLRCRCHDAKIAVEPSFHENVADSFCGSDEPCKSAYAIVPRDAVLEHGDMKFTREHPFVTKVHLIECLGVCDLGMLSGHLSLTELRVEVRGKVSHHEALRELPSLKNLWLHGNKMTLTDFFHVGEVKGLEKLTLCGALNLKCLEMVAQVPQQKALDLSETLITDKCLRAVGLCKALIRLDLSCCNRLRDVSLLTRIPILEELNLKGCCNITNGIGTVKDLPRLRVLSMSSTPLCSGFFADISGIASLVRLDFSSCWEAPSPSSFPDFPAKMNAGGRRVFFCLSFKQVEGTALLGRLPKLQSLNMSRTAVTDDCVRGLRMCERLVWLDLSSCVKLTDVTPLSFVETLEEVNLSWCKNLKSGSGVLRHLPRLRVLDLKSTAVDNRCFRGVDHKGGLVNRMLQWSGLTVPRFLRRLICCDGSLVVLDFFSYWRLTNVAPLAVIATPEELRLVAYKNLHGGVDDLGRLSELQLLDLSGTPITDDSLRGLSYSKSLASLNLSACANLTDVSPLTRISSLEELDLQENWDINKGIRELVNLSRLYVVYLSGTGWSLEAAVGLKERGAHVRRT